MAWPSANVSLANVDSASDTVSSARADIYDAMNKLNEIITEGPAIEAVAVSGQSTITTSGSNGTLTLVAGGNVTLTTNTTAKSVTINSTGGGITELADDPSPTLGGDLNVGNNYIEAVGYSYVGVNDTLIALSSVAAMAGDTSFAGNAVSLTMATSTVASLKTNNNSTGNPNGVRLDITGDQINILPWNGTTKIGALELAQSTGTPSNTSTPTGYIQVIINGTTRYIPYYT
jgi:hypothetical protein